MPTVVNRGIDAPASRREIRKENAENFAPIVNGRSMRPPIRTIYIHSVSPRTFTIGNRPLFPPNQYVGTDPSINNGRWITCTSFSDPIVQIGADNERGGNRTDDNDTWISLIDMLRSGNYTTDPYHGSNNPDFYANRLGTNYICEGLFPSLNEIPTEQELKRAEECRSKRIQWGVREAKRLAARSRRELDEFLTGNEWVHEAMAELGQTAEWTQNNTVMALCPNCGESVRPNIAFHVSNGKDCIISWKAAWEAGRVKKEDVPPKHRWQGFGKVEEEV